jgi:CzcA family heavy metal efflux pump
MMRWLVGGSIRFRLLIVAAAAAVLLVGASQLREMPTDVLPEFAPPTVEIQTEALGLSAAEVEQLITVPMEQDLLVGVAFLDDIRSESLPGLSRIFLTFEPGTDIYRARQVVAERMTQAHALPNVSKPPQMIQPLSSTNRVMIVGASTEKLTPVEMGVLARWTIAPRLVGVEGVANVSVWGFRDRQLQVQVDPQRLRQQDISLAQVVETAGNSLWFSPLTFVEASTPGVGGFIDTPNQRLGIQHISPINSAADLAQVRVEDTGDRNVLLGDIANVVEDHQPLIGDALVEEGNGDLLFVVEKLPEANTQEVTSGIENTIAAMAPGLTSVTFDTNVYRPASYLDSAVENLSWSLLIGALLMVLVVGAIFFSWRTTVVSIVVVPVSLVAAALVLWMLGTSMNAIIAAGLAAALVVIIDDAIIGVENVARRLREQRSAPNGASRSAVILSATLEMRGITAYALVIVALALVPFFFAEGVAGSFFPDLAGAFLLALLTSMVVALMLVPALSMLLLRGTSLDRRSPLAHWIQTGYERGLSRIVSRWRMVFVAAGLVALAAIATIPLLSTSLLPTFKERQLLIRWDGRPGTSLPEMKRITARAARELRTLDGVDDVGAHVGRAVGSDLSVNANAAELWVSVDPSADYGGAIRSIREVVGGYPGLTTNVGSYSNERVESVLADRAVRDLVVRLYGEDPMILQQQAERIRQTVSGIRGIEDASVIQPTVEPTIEVKVDLAAAQANGIKPGDVRRAAATMLGGLVVGNLFEQQKVFEVVVWGTPDTRRSLTSIRDLLVDTPDGRQVRLGDVADVRIAPDPSVVERQAVSRFLDIGASVNGRDRGDAVRDVKGALAEMRFPLEYTTDVLGTDGQPWGRLIGLALAAIVGIFLLLQACFASWRLAALLFLAFPFALTGGLLAVAVTGGDLAFGSVMGLVAVYAIAVRNGMGLVDRFRRLARDGQPHGQALVLIGSRDRVVPVVTTAAAAAAAMLPALVAGGDAGREIVNPMAAVVIGGLITATLLTLFCLPVLYLRFGAQVVYEPDGAEELLQAIAPTKEPSLAGVAMVPQQVTPEPST